MTRSPHAPPLRGSLPPEGAGPALGRPGGWPVCRPHATPLRGSLPPKGADLARERPFAAVGGRKAASLHRWLQSATVALALGLAAPAWAQIWGYIDENGSGHFASEKLDNRYKLFSVYDAPVRPGKKPAPAVASGRSRQLASLEASPRYQAVSHLIREAASTHGLDVALLKAVIATESGFDPNAVSPKGAVGLMQLMPATAERFGVRAQANQSLQERLTDPRTNLQAGARYLALLLRQFGGQLDLALAAYNAGEGAVLRAGRQVPNFPETQNYVRSVSQLHQSQSAAVVQPLPQAEALRPLPGGALGRGNMPAAPL